MMDAKIIKHINKIINLKQEVVSWMGAADLISILNGINNRPEDLSNNFGQKQLHF